MKNCLLISKFLMITPVFGKDEANIMLSCDYSYPAMGVLDIHTTAIGTLNEVKR